MQRKKLFISHAAKDRGLVEALSKLIENGTALQPSEISALSLEAGLIPEGEDLLAYVESKIEQPDLVIVLLTPNYILSRFCLCELGVCWALSRNVIPILVPPLTPQHVKTIIPAASIRKIDSTDDLNVVATQLHQDLALGNMNLPRWAMEKKRFLALLPALITQVSGE